jgi:branched-chain amino acid transport system substrate-binding protein
MLFASAYVKRGGSIVQELYPPQGASDYGPYLAQLSQGGNVLFTFLPGVDGMHFLDQLNNYGGQRKLPTLDGFGTATSGPNRAQLKDKAVGVVADSLYSTAFDSPENKALVKAFADKYPGRLLSSDVAQGYSGAQIIADAIKKVDGNVDDRQKFLDALYNVDAQTAKGEVTLDADHDVVENIYLFQIVKNGDSYEQKLLQTYPSVSKTWDRSADDVKRFPWGKLKGKWVGMTADKLAQM